MPATHQIDNCAVGVLDGARQRLFAVFLAGKRALDLLLLPRLQQLVLCGVLDDLVANLELLDLFDCQLELLVFYRVGRSVRRI